MQNNFSLQVNEPLSEGITRSWAIKEVLYSGDTNYQNVMIGKSAHGITLFCDGERQSSEQTQLCYHEALVIPGLLLTRLRRRALVIGSSEGVVSKMLIDQGFEKVVHVDIDEECVRICSKFLPYGYQPIELATASTANDQIELIFADGYKFVSDALQQSEMYDFIIVDLPDETESADSQHDKLYDVDFIQKCANLLHHGGCLTFQAGCQTLWRQNTLLKAVERFKNVFPTILPYVSDEHEWTFISGTFDVFKQINVADHASKKFSCLKSVPETIDSKSIIRGSVLPFHVRRNLEEN